MVIDLKSFWQYPMSRKVLFDSGCQIPLIFIDQDKSFDTPDDYIQDKDLLIIEGGPSVFKYETHVRASRVSHFMD